MKILFEKLQRKTSSIKKKDRTVKDALVLNNFAYSRLTENVPEKGFDIIYFTERLVDSRNLITAKFIEIRARFSQRKHKLYVSVTNINVKLHLEFPNEIRFCRQRSNSNILLYYRIERVQL